MKPHQIVQAPPEAERRPCLISHHLALPGPPAVTLKSGLIGTRPGWSYARELVKLTVRARFNAEATRKWISYWNLSLLSRRLASAQPSVLKKIYRPYLSARLSCEGRLAVLTSHYDFIDKLGLGPMVLRAATRPVQLAEISGKSGSTYQLELLAMGPMEREGELVLQLLNDGVIIYSVAFTFIVDRTMPSVAIGCLQGGRSDGALHKIGVATRDLYGLRPKSLMARLVQQIGQAFGCSDLLLVGNSNRVMHQQIRKGRVSADYDRTWNELGAVRKDDGDYVLPCLMPSGPDFSTIASNKRSAAKKRFALLASTAHAVCTAMKGRSPDFKVIARNANLANHFPSARQNVFSLVPMSLHPNSR